MRAIVLLKIEILEEINWRDEPLEGCKVCSATP